MSWISQIWSNIKPNSTASPEDNPRHIFSDDERQLSKIARLEKSIRRRRLEQLEDELRELQEHQEEEILLDKIERTKRNLYGDDDDDDEYEDGLNPDALITSLLSKVLNAPSKVPETPSGQTNLISVSDEEIRQFKKSVPKEQLKQIHKLTDDQLINQIKQRIPNADDNSIARAVIILKEK